MPPFWPPWAKTRKSLCHLENELNSTLEYRLYLQNNAEKIIDNNYNVIDNLTKCKTCSGYEIIDSNILLTCNKETCSQNIQNNNGIGLEANYVI